MMRSHLLRIVLALLALVVGGVQADAQSPAKVKIRLDWKGGAQHAPFYLGKENGLFQGRGNRPRCHLGLGLIRHDQADRLQSRGIRPGRRARAGARRATTGAGKVDRGLLPSTPIVLISPKAKPVTDPRQLLDGSSSVRRKAARPSRVSSRCSPPTTCSSSRSSSSTSASACSRCWSSRLTPSWASR